MPQLLSVLEVPKEKRHLWRLDRSNCLLLYSEYHNSEYLIVQDRSEFGYFLIRKDFTKLNNTPATYGAIENLMERVRTFGETATLEWYLEVFCLPFDLNG